MSTQLTTAHMTTASHDNAEVTPAQLLLRLLAHEHSLDWRIWKDHQGKIEAVCQAIDECEMRGKAFVECVEAETRELEISEGEHCRRFYARVPKGIPMLGEESILRQIKEGNQSVTMRIRRAGGPWEVKYKRER